MPTKKSSSSPAKRPQPGRYAHPFYEKSASDPAHHASDSPELEAWAKLNLGPLPKVIGQSTMQLGDLLGEAAVQEIQALGQIRFHAVGDTGRSLGVEMEEVARDMALDYHPKGGGQNPAFFFHLGDVIYSGNKDSAYLDAFYRPYSEYPGKIIAIPGNHDGEVRPKTDPVSLEAFLANFCAPTAAVPQLAKSIGVYRETMTQPGVYFWLSAPFIDVVGLYSNCIETHGYLEGQNGDQAQIEWLAATMKEIAKGRQKERKALLIGVHHPPYSMSVHPGSPDLIANIDKACQAAGLMPDAVISGHAHNYQRHTRRIQVAGKPVEIPYIVGGCGGYGSQPVQEAYGQVIGETTYDKAIKSYGYLLLTASAHKLTIDFWDVAAKLQQPADTVSVSLETSRLL